METPKPTQDYHSNVDTSRPFRSVKEAVANFGERILVGGIYTAAPSPIIYPNDNYYNATTTTTTNYSNVNSPVVLAVSPKEMNNISSSPSTVSDHILDALKKVEAELEETKAELKLLKEREQETEVAVASLNAELHRSMSKLAEAEAATAAKAAAAKTATTVETSTYSVEKQEERIGKELVRRTEKKPTLAQILRLGEKDNKVYSHHHRHGRKRERKTINKLKPIVPLLGDLFSRKK